MPVYISKPYKPADSFAWKHKMICDMIADTEKELNDMALKLGISEFEITELKGLPMFHLTQTQREYAANMRARLCSDNGFEIIINKLKNKIKPACKGEAKPELLLMLSKRVSKPL